MPDVKIEISADLGNTLSATEQLKSKLNQTKETVELLKAELKGLNQSLAANDKSMATVNKQLKGLNTNTKDGAKEAAGLKAQLSTLAGVNNTLAKGIVTTKLELANETAALKTHTKEVANAEKGGSAMAKGLGKVWGGLRLLANIIPGLGIGGLVAIISGPLVDALAELFKKSNQAKEALQSTFADAEGSVGGNIARLKALVSIAQDVSKSDDARREALGALNKEYDNFNGKLTLANINTQFATNLINKQTAALIRQAKIKGVEDLITEETKKATQISIKAIKDQMGALDQIGNAIAIALNPTLGQADGLVKGLRARDKALKESKGNIEIYSAALKKLLSEEADEGTLFKEPKGKTVKELKKKIEKAFVPESLLLRPSLIDISPETVLLNKAKAEKELNDSLGNFKMTPIRLDVDLGEAFRRLQEIYKFVEEQNIRATESLKQTFNNAFASVGESIADSLSSGASFGEAVFGNLFKVLGAGLKQLGEAMIAIGTAKIALEKFKFAPGIATVVAGIAAVALGSILQNAIPGFANGVNNFGGGLAMVGERGPELVRLPKGSDVIPNGRMTGVSGTGMAISVEGRIVGNGSDLVMIIDRARQRNSRNN
jgi:chromosome segregation ATPase